MNTSSTNSRYLSGARSGMFLIMVLISLSVVMALAASWMRTISLERRHVRASADRLQAEFLAASGMRRAAAQLAADGGYAGETWRIDGESLGTVDGATVVIRVAADSAGPRRRRVTVEASYPDDPSRRARQTQQATIQLAAEK
jgi:hypothetical protein